MRDRRSFAFALVLACAQPPQITAPLASVTTAQAPRVDLDVRAPAEVRYHRAALESEPVEIAVRIDNATDRVVDTSALVIDVIAHLANTTVACRRVEDDLAREPQVAPHTSLTLTRNVCSLPVVGDYALDVVTTLDGATEHHSLGLRVVPDSGVVHARVDAFVVAMGGAPLQMRYTAREWQAGAFRIGIRMTNLSPRDAVTGNARITFSVTKDGQPLSCTSTVAIALPSLITSGRSAVVSVPVTCVIDVRGKFDIAAEFTLGEAAPVSLGSCRVEVTTDPQIYLPHWER
jgi:hypothetical protein